MSRAELRPRALDLGTKSLEGIEAQLDEVLRQLQRKVRGIRGSVVADSNGLTIASDIREGVSPATLAAMSTLIAQSAGSVFENIEMPGPDLIMMEGPESNVVVMHIALADVTMLTLMDRSTNQLRYGAHSIFFFRGTYTIAAAVAKEGDAEALQYHILDALQDFEDRYAATLESWNGDISVFPGLDDCFEKVIKG